eukprot:jgi/Mesen1/3608/ME000020S03138
MQTLTWLLPERFASSELAPEGLSTLIGLLTTLNQHIVDTAPRGPPRGHPGAPEAPASREQGKVPWGLWVAIMKEVEVLGEMAAAQVYGEDGKWGPIAAIEAVNSVMASSVNVGGNHRIRSLPLGNSAVVSRHFMLRRKTLLLLYLLRSPCFDQFTRRPVEGMESALKSLPLIGTLAEKGLELLLGIQSIYFYTAAS